MFDENGNFIGFMLPGNQPNTPKPKGVYNPWTGIDTSGRTGGYDQYGQGIAAMIPGGGALAGIGQIAGGVADIMASKKEIERQRKLKQEAAAEAKKSRSALDAFEFDVSQAQRDLATAGIRPTDTSYIQSGLATSLGAMQDLSLIHI